MSISAKRPKSNAGSTDKPPAKPSQPAPEAPVRFDDWASI